jgi:dCTP deaminase
MSILSDSAIEFARLAGSIVIEPFDPKCLGGNSYDVHLSPHFGTYAEPIGPMASLGEQNFWNADPAASYHAGFKHVVLDAKIEPVLHRFDIPDTGYLLMPNILYLGATSEYTEAHDHLPDLDGKSSGGRLGVSIHVTAGKGDVGFCGHWTLEITVVHPTVIYPGMPIGQLRYSTVKGEVRSRYGDKPGAKYANRSPLPQGSRMHRNFTP